jgi:preprotein translocase subunit SecF
MSRIGDFTARLYRGEVGYDFVGRRKLWYSISVLIAITALVGLFTRGINESIDFKGGAVFTTPKTSVSVEQALTDAQDASGKVAVVQKLGTGGLRIQIAEIGTKQSDAIQSKLAKDLNVPESKIAADLVGPSWGSTIADKAWTGLIVFLVLVVIYLAIAFEWRMALAAFVALIHDIVITVGVYALVGFQVSPGTVIGLLTILGYSLYDTVVVFDSLKEQSKGITKQTALLPVAGLLFIGGGLLGAGTFNDISLALFIGLTAGAYSSIFIATPLVATLKESEPQMKALRKRVLAKRASAARDEAPGAAPGDAQDDPAVASTSAVEEASPAVAGPRRGRPGRSSGRRR